VLVGGRVVVRDRKMTTLDAEEVMARANQIRGQIQK
jgi:hypothetical protein